MSSKPSGSSSGPTPDSDQSLQSKLTVQLTPVKEAPSKGPDDQQTLVAVRLLADREGPTADKAITGKLPLASQTQAQQVTANVDSKQSTQRPASSSAGTTIWGSQPPGSIDVRAAMKRPSTSSPPPKPSAAKTPSPKRSPIRRFSYASQPSATYSEERFQVSPLKASPHSPPFSAMPQQQDDEYERWPAPPRYADAQYHAVLQPSVDGQFSFQQPCPQYPPMGPPGFMPGSQHEQLFPDYSMAAPFIPGAEQHGLLQQGSYFAYDQVQTAYQQTMHQGAFVQGAHAPQHVSADGLPPGLQQPYMAPYPMQQPLPDQPPMPQDMGMQWWADNQQGHHQQMFFDMPYEPSPMVIRLSCAWTLL